MQEILIAELMEIGFQSFEQTDSELRAILPEQACNDELESSIQKLIDALSIASWSREVVEEINWNEMWEQSIRPILTDSFLIRPSWIDLQPPDGIALLIIDPKMSFGTGVHPTTRLILSLLPDVMKKKPVRVLDAGTGTGILAIAAAKLGAEEVVAFDSDPWSERNTRENIDTNKVADSVSVMCGEIDVIQVSPPFDLVMANINRNALLTLSRQLTSRVAKGGTLILSGLLDTDRAVILETYLSLNMRLTDERSEGEWIAIQFSSDPL